MAWRHGTHTCNAHPCMRVYRCAHPCVQVYRQEDDYFRSLLAAIRDPQAAKQALADLQTICSRCDDTKPSLLETCVLLHVVLHLALLCSHHAHLQGELLLALAHAHPIQLARLLLHAGPCQ